MSNVASFNNPSTGFRLENAVQGRSLALTRSGVTPTQTPSVFDGAGPFVLTPNQLETALVTGLVFRNGPTLSSVTLQLPSTASITSIISAVGVTNPNTPGAWVSLRLINQSASTTITLVAGDGSTTIAQQTIQALTTQTYTLCEVIGGVVVLQDTYHLIRRQRQFVTAQLSQPQTLVARPAPVLFDTIVTQSPSTDLVSFNVGTSSLEVAPGVVVLLNVNFSVTNPPASAVNGGPTAQIAPAGQVVTPLTGIIASSSTFLLNNTSGEFVLSAVYTNTTLATTFLQVYLIFFNPPRIVEAAPGITAQFTATQVAQL